MNSVWKEYDGQEYGGQEYGGQEYGGQEYGGVDGSARLNEALNQLAMANCL